ncbi:MAG: trypsin-like peptidase domain-containing protein [Acidobacteria bacterium]|nr:trypsin-like peptidase domain-containing protein [Acidobacteriota bacterium]
MMKRQLPLWLTLLFLAAFAVEGVRAQQTDLLPELVRRVKPAVVSIITYDSHGEMKMTGSGFFIRPGEVITNLHVIDGAHHAEIRTFDGKGKTYTVRGISGVDEEGDLALLNIEMPEARARTLELAADVPDEGEKIFVIGNPLRLEGSVSDGIVSAVREVPSLGKIIQITAPISPGNSGSPVFNMRGEVIGVVTIKVTNGQNISLALGAQRVTELKAGKLQTFEQLSARSKENQKAEAVSEWWYQNGLNSLWLGRYENALGYFENAVNKNPNRAEAWIQVGYCQVKQGKNRDAIKAFKQALKLRPNSYEAYNKLGDAYYYAGSFYEALAAYRQAARLRPEFAETYFNLAMTYLELEDRSAALAESRILQPLDKGLYEKLMNEIQR